MFNSGNNPDVVKTALDSVFYAAFDYEMQPGFAGARNEDLFKQDSVDRAAVITDVFSDVGDWDESLEEEERTLTTVTTGQTKTHSVVNFKKTLAIPQEFFEDDQHDTVDNAVRRVGERGRMKQDKNALLNYVNGFSTVLTSDGVALFSNSHVLQGSGETVDNLELGVLNPANLETLVRSLWEQKAQDGELGAHVVAFLLVPPILFPDAQEITKSELKPGTANNDLNYFSAIYPGLKVYTNAYIGQTISGLSGANTAYYIGSRNHSMKRWTRVAINTKIVPPDTDSKDRWMYKSRFREVVSPISFEGLAASNGTV